MPVSSFRQRLLPLWQRTCFGSAPSSSRNLARPITKSGSPQSAKVLPCSQVCESVIMSTSRPRSFFERRRDRLAGHLGNLHQELIGPFQAHGNVRDRDLVGPRVLDVLGRLVKLPGLKQERRGRIRSVLDLLLRRPPRVHPELAVGRRVEHLFGIGKEGERNVHLAEHSLDARKFPR